MTQLVQSAPYVNTVLEALGETRASLADETVEWDFENWPSCTCGHVYRGVTGAKATLSSDIRSPSGERAELFLATLRAIADASPETQRERAEASLPDQDDDIATEALVASNLTRVVAGLSPTGSYDVGEYGGRLREAAVKLIDRAIERETALDERSRRLVAAGEWA